MNQNDPGIEILSFRFEAEGPFGPLQKVHFDCEQGEGCHKTPCPKEDYKSCDNSEREREREIFM